LLNLPEGTGPGDSMMQKNGTTRDSDSRLREARSGIIDVLCVCTEPCDHLSEFAKDRLRLALRLSSDEAVIAPPFTDEEKAYMKRMMEARRA
jgi:adenine specific DNA methylase Mod